jgi:hypothetical protein
LTTEPEEVGRSVGRSEEAEREPGRKKPAPRSGKRKRKEKTDLMTEDASGGDEI